MEHIKKVHHIRNESVELKTKQVAVKLEEKRKTIEAKQEAARIELEKQRQAKQERFKDVLQHAHEKKEILVKVLVWLYAQPNIEWNTSCACIVCDNFVIDVPRL